MEAKKTYKVITLLWADFIKLFPAKPSALIGKEIKREFLLIRHYAENNLVVKVHKLSVFSFQNKTMITYCLEYSENTADHATEKPAVKTDKSKFTIGQNYSYLTSECKKASLLVTDRTEKTITFLNNLGEVITRHILEIGVNYECFSPSGKTIRNMDVCRSYDIKTAAVKSTVKPAVKPAEVNTNNKIIFEVGQTYCYGYACGDTVVTIEIIKRTEKTVTFKDRNKLVTRKINYYDLLAESIYPNRAAVCSAKDKVTIN